MGVVKVVGVVGVIMVIVSFFFSLYPAFLIILLFTLT